MTTRPARTAEPIAPQRPGRVAGGIGEDVLRPDAPTKVRGEFAYSSDLWADGMLWGGTVRSPHPSARIISIDTSAAEAMDGVECVLLAADVPGNATYGLEISDQPVLASDVVRYQGEAIAVVAADHPETARRAADAVDVQYEVQTPLVDPEAALEPDAPRLHDSGNITRHVRIRHGDPDATAPVVVRGVYDIGMQDQAFLGPESGLAIPDADGGGVHLYISTQWLHVDRDQVAACLGLPPERVTLTLAGVGGAFGAREDLSMQVHSCLLALRTGKPVKMMYSREESFFGHVHRHPGKLYYEHGADEDGNLVYIRNRLILDGGAYASSSTAVAANAACFSCGPYEVPNAAIDSYVAYTNNPPCGAMRGFGAVQCCFAYETQMDRLAAKLGMDPLELRLRNAMHEGSILPTGQVVTGAAPVRELLEALRDATPPAPADPADPGGRPGGWANTTHGEGVQRGSGIAIGFKNVCYAEGFDDFSTARVRITASPDGPVVHVHTAASEVGQGLTTILGQIARTELDLEQVVVLPADTNVGNSGSSSASRQSYMTGGACQVACRAVRDAVINRAAEHLAVAADGLVMRGGNVGSADGSVGVCIDELLGRYGDFEETREYHHKPTHPLDLDTGQGDAHVQLAFAAHRAWVDVDGELGIVRPVHIATSQDVGKILNPTGCEGQIDGGIAQGVGLAVMEEIQVVDGEVRNPSFTDYLIPTVLDMPTVAKRIFEFADPDAPYGLRGVGEPPTISSTPAVVAAIRDATGRALPRIPVRADDIVFGDELDDFPSPPVPPPGERRVDAKQLAHGSVQESVGHD